MMISGASNPLAGKLTIKGAAQQAPENTPRNPLASGLKISNRTSATSAQNAAKATEQAKEAEKKQKLVQNFEATLLARLEKTEKPGGNGQAPEGARAEEAKNLANSITATIEQIKKEFGQETANEVMANILTGTEGGVTADRVAAAIGNTFQAIANSSKPNMATASEDDLAKADETNKKLEKMLKFLNEGAAGDEGKGGSLRDSLNSFFGMDDFEEDDQDRFDANFKWISKNEEIENERAKGNDEKEFYLTFEELGKDNVDKLVNFLRNDLGDEDAAQYIESLGADGDIFEAVQELNKMFYEDSELVSYYNSRDDWSPPHHEGPGMDKIFELSQFLNDNILDEVNNVIRTDDKVRSRFMDMAGKKLGSTDDITDTYGLAGWSFNGSASVNGETGEHTFDYQFAIHDTQGKTAEERNIDQIKGWADFNRQLAATHPDKKEQYTAGANSFDKQYEEAMAAYKAKKALQPTEDMDDATSEEQRIKQLKAEADLKRVMAESDPLKREKYLAAAAKMDQEYEEAMAAYKAKTAPPTPPGSMVKTTV